MKEKPIIVTGAAGFIGRNTVAALNQRGRTNLLLVDHLGHEEKWQNLLGLQFDDLISPEKFLALIQEDKLPKAEACIHLGACSATTEKDADHLLENNTHYTQALCEWNLKKGTRFVYASSAATYGDGEHGYRDNEAELDNLRPLNMYGYSKHLFDLWARRHGLFDQIVGLKYFNVYGPFEDHKHSMRSLVQKAYYQVRDHGFLDLFKSHRHDYQDGAQKRDFIYVRDAVNVTLYFALDTKASGLFNCGTGQARTWVDLAHALFAAMNRPPDIRFIDMPEILRAKYQYFTEADMGKLRRAGYLQPFFSLEEGVRDYVQSHLSWE
jgi:ADP-L-glycero-D-manno-heptose 6-epimerase